MDPGTHALAMIIDILLGRSPLCLGEKNYAEMDVELIFGKGFKSSDFNDDALARTLDKIHAAGAEKVFRHASLKALLKEELESGVAPVQWVLQCLDFKRFLLISVD